MTSKIEKIKIDLSNIRVCTECQVLFLPKKPWFHTCPHCFVEDNNECDGCIEDTF